MQNTIVDQAFMDKYHNTLNEDGSIIFKCIVLADGRITVDDALEDIFPEIKKSLQDFPKEELTTDSFKDKRVFSDVEQAKDDQYKAQTDLDAASTNLDTAQSDKEAAEAANAAALGTQAKETAQIILDNAQLALDNAKTVRDNAVTILTTANATLETLKAQRGTN